MQSQATRAGRSKFNPMIVLTLAAGILLAVAVLATNDVIDLPFTSETETASIGTSSDVDLRRQQYIEQKFQLPSIDFGSQPKSLEQMRFLEQNLYLPTGVLPRPLPAGRPSDGPPLSVERMIFLEQNIWENTGLPKEPPRLYPADQLD